MNRFLAASLIALCTTGCASSRAATVSEQIIVDQFGWRTDAARKVAVFADPVQGQNAAVDYTPGDTFELRKASDNSVVFTGPITAWRNGEVHKVSGDKAWWADFSAFKTPGEYYIHDPQNDFRSYTFRIADDVFAPVLRASFRTFYYQRCGTAVDKKHGGAWTHAACHIGPNQDRAAQMRSGGKSQGPERDVSGGWHDAGDHNKYVPYLASTLWDYMMAYELQPATWDDSSNIPESGNGVPDILDELKYELDWLLKMQREDGAVFNRVVVLSYDSGSGPDNDKQARFYTPPTTWATSIFAASLAHAARVFKVHEKTYPGYSKRLRDAAVQAWEYLEQNPNMLPANGVDGAGQVAASAAGADAKGDRRSRIYAAAELFSTTGDERYHDYFRAHYKNKEALGESNQHPLEGAFDASINADLTRAFFTYAKAAKADDAIVQEIKTALKNAMDWTVAGSYEKGEDPYRAYMYDGHYSWGSNSAKASWAKLAIMAVELGVQPEKDDLYREVAEEYVHYFHGRNPLSWVYLSNMGDKGAKLGAEKSVLDLYHGWFNSVPRYKEPSEIGMAPGFIAGGPNQFFSKDWIKPPHGEPPMKAYKDWSAAWNAQRNDNESSWEITEPAIYYQAGYTMVLAYFSVPPEAAEKPKPK